MNKIIIEAFPTINNIQNEHTETNHMLMQRSHTFNSTHLQKGSFVRAIATAGEPHFIQSCPSLKKKSRVKLKSTFQQGTQKHCKCLSRRYLSIKSDLLIPAGPQTIDILPTISMPRLSKLHTCMSCHDDSIRTWN